MKITPQRPPASTILSTEGKEKKKIDNTVENSTILFLVLFLKISVENQL